MEDKKPVLNLLMPDLRQEVKQNLPVLFEFIPEPNRTWGKAQKLFNAEVERNYSKAKGETIKIEANLYLIIDKAQKGDGQAKRLLNFFQKLLEETLQHTSAKEIPKIRKNIKDILLNVDHKYLNFFGEIAILNNLLKQRYFQLEAVEAPLSDSKSTIDFKIRNINTNTTLLVEVYNVHLNADKVENDKEKIESFLTTKFKNKIRKKDTKELFYLVPVIWGSASDLLVYSDFFTHNQLPIKGLIEPVAYSTFISPEGESIFNHRFGRLSTLFNDKFGDQE